MVVAVAQLALTVGELDANRQAGRAAVAEAAAAGARLVVLPELSDSGYVFSDAGEARSLAATAESCVTLSEWRSLAASHDRRPDLYARLWDHAYPAATQAD